MNMYLSIIILLIMAAAAAPFFIRSLLWNRALKAVREGRDADFIKIIRSRAYHLFFGTYNQEWNLLRLYIARTNTKKAQEQIEKLLSMKLSEKERRQVCSSSFFYFIERNRKETCEKLLTELKTCSDPDEYAYDKMLYEVNLCHSTDYIDFVKKKIEEQNARKVKKDETADRDVQIGLLYYFLALQYKERNDKEEFQEAVSKARKLLKNTPYSKRVKALSV